VNHEIAFSDDGAAAGLTVATVFPPEHRRRPIQSDPNHSFRIQRLRLDDTGSIVSFAKEFLYFSIL
jgi:hypothetical protein